MKEPLVSVVIPVFNDEKNIGACIESVLTQTLNDIEIILINDGSTDNTNEILNRYANEDSRIVVVNKANGGLSSARNVGLKNATGTYLMYLDSDDYLEKTALSKCYQSLSSLNLDILFFNAELVYDTEELRQSFSSHESYYLSNGVYDGVYRGVELFSELRKNGDYCASACLQIAKQKFLHSNSLLFYEGIIHEDELYTSSCLIQAQRTTVLPEKLYKRRIRADSITTDTNKKRSVEGLFICILEMHDMVLRNDLTDEQAKCLQYRIDTLSGITIERFALMSEKSKSQVFTDADDRIKRLFGQFIVETKK